MSNNPAAVKETSASEKKQNPNMPYILAGILIAVFTAINLLLMGILNKSIKSVFDTTQEATFYINEIDSHLAEVNGNVLKLVGNVGEEEGIIANIQREFESIHSSISSFQQVPNVSESLLKRFNSAITYVNAYEQKLSSYYTQYQSSGTASLSKYFSNMEMLYTQDIQHLQLTSSEMLRASIDISNTETEQQRSNVNTSFQGIIISMLAILVLGELAVVLIASLSRKSRTALDQKEKMLNAVDAKLQMTRQKANDIAFTDLLTGMKNRYSLSDDLEERLASDNFFIAVFDIDNFRSVNNTYGADFGDTYLSEIAESLKKDFGSAAKLYMISGHEFCFIFNENTTQTKASMQADSIFAKITAPYTIENISIQMPASGVLYNYRARSFKSASALLAMLDSTIADIKKKGGNHVEMIL